jgi:hypothetical protein
MQTPRISSNRFTTKDYAAFAVIMALMGAFLWAIRGTGGFGGSQGGLYAGLGWAILFYLFAGLDGQRALRPYGGPRVIAAITFGVAFGGMTGWGVYTAWVQGIFHHTYPDAAREIAPWTGYLALFFCGLHWGGNAGAFLAWCAPRIPATWRTWVGRIAAAILGAVLAHCAVRLFPQFFFHFYAEGIYDNPDYATVQRTWGAIPNVAQHVGIFFGLMAFEAMRRDWRAVKVMSTVSLGFAFGLSAGGWWHTFHGTQPPIDWWKNWEMSSGMGGGLGLATAFILFNRPESGRLPRVACLAERAWGGGATLLLAGWATWRGAYHGFVNHFPVEWPGIYQRAYSHLFLFCALVALGIWVIRMRRAQAPPAEHRIVPHAALWSAMALIIAAGYIVSLHPALTLANHVLFVAYTVCIAISALLAVFLHRRRILSGDDARK